MPLLAQIDGQFGLDVLPVVAGALILVGLSVGVSLWMKLGVERSVVWAGLRASGQLLAVGLIFSIIFESARANLWGVLWIAMMITVAVVVLVRRAPDIPGLWLPAIAAVTGTVLVALAVIFGLQVMEWEPVRAVVIAGLTIGNSMPAGVGGAKQVSAAARSRPGEIEALLALGLGHRDVVRYLAPPAASLALVPQIERTKVVGLIALPGAMAGLLLAGADPIEAVVLQLLVMFIVLGAVALSVLVLSVAVSRGAVTKHLSLAEWVRSNE